MTTTVETIWELQQTVSALLRQTEMLESTIVDLIEKIQELRAAKELAESVELYKVIQPA